MNNREIFEALELEIRESKKKHPNWPDHVCGQAGIVCEEAGELMRAAVNYKYQKSKDACYRKQQQEELKKEALHTAVTAIRFLENIKI